MDEETLRIILPVMTQAGKEGAKRVLTESETDILRERAELEKKLSEKQAETFKKIAENINQGPQTGGNESEKEQKELSEVGEASVSMMRKYLETEKIEHLKDAKTAIGSVCPPCAKNIQMAIDAIEDEDKERAKEIVYGILGSLVMSTEEISFKAEKR